MSPLVGMGGDGDGWRWGWVEVGMGGGRVWWGVGCNALDHITIEDLHYDPPV